MGGCGVRLGRGFGLDSVVGSEGGKEVGEERSLGRHACGGVVGVVIVHESFLGLYRDSNTVLGDGEGMEM